MTHGPAYKTGMALFALLALSDLAGLAALGSSEGPPKAVTVIGGLLGAMTLAALPAAHRSEPKARGVVLASRVLSALLGVPAFFVADPPSWAAPLVAVSLALTVVGIALVANERRMVTA
jgi:hypothetical protein